MIDIFVCILRLKFRVTKLLELFYCVLNHQSELMHAY